MARVNKTKPSVTTQLKPSDTKVQLPKGVKVYSPSDDSHVTDGKSYKS